MESLMHPVALRAYLSELEKLGGLPRRLVQLAEEATRTGKPLHSMVGSPAIRERMVMHDVGRTGGTGVANATHQDAATLQSLTHTQNRARVGKGMKGNVQSGMDSLKGNMDVAGVAPKPSPRTGATAGVQTRSAWERQATNGAGWKAKNPSAAQQAYSRASASGRGAAPGQTPLDRYYQGRGPAPTNNIRPGGPKVSFLP